MTSPLKIPVLFLLAILLFPGIARATPAFDPPVRIKLSRFFPVGTQRVLITSAGPFSVSDQTGTSIVQAPSGANYNFTSQSASVVSIASPAQKFDPEESQAGSGLTGAFFTVHSSPGFTISVTGSSPGASAHHYRGTLLILPGLNLVNTLPLEEYLKGVLSPEIGASAPEEALKAQAIAARTYTIKNLGKFSEAGADLDDTTHSESYLGADGETPSIINAVAQTTGQVLLYHGAVIDAVFSTDCGGMTGAGDPSEPYLSPVADPQCGLEPPWQLDLTRAEALSLLDNADPAPTAKVTMTVTQTDESGRASSVTIAQGDQQKVITGVELRKKLGYDKLRSTLFKISQTADGGFHIVGQGWGHGLGLCQRGAIYLAQHSIACDAILKHYYTGASIAALDPAMIPAAPTAQMISSLPRPTTPPGP